MNNLNFSANYQYEKLKENITYDNKTLSGLIKNAVSHLVSLLTTFIESNTLIFINIDNYSNTDKDNDISNKHSQKQKRNNSSYSLADNEKQNKLPTLLGGSQNSLHI